MTVCVDKSVHVLLYYIWVILSIEFSCSVTTGRLHLSGELALAGLYILLDVNANKQRGISAGVQHSDRKGFLVYEDQHCVIGILDTENSFALKELRGWTFSLRPIYASLHSMCDNALSIAFLANWQTFRIITPTFNCIEISF